MQGLGNHLFDHRIIDRARRTGPRLIEQSIQTLAYKSSSPFTYRLRRDPQLLRNLAIGTIPLTAQYDARPHRQCLRGLMPSGPLSKTIALFRSQRDGFKSRAASHRISLNIHSNFGHRGCINVQ